MNSEQDIIRLLEQTERAYHTFKYPYLKVPSDLALFALRNRKTAEARVYLASQFAYSGKARISEQPVKEIAALCETSVPTVYRSLDWLLSKNWISKDADNGWIFFRGFKRLYEIEGWRNRNCAVMFAKDLPTVKAFFIGAALSEFIKRNRGTGTDRKSKRSQPARYPVSLYDIQNLLKVSEKTAFNYRKLAQKYQYIKMIPNLQQINGITTKDVLHLKANDIGRVELPLFGSTDTLSIYPKQLRMDKGFIYAQLANFIYPQVIIKKRKAVFKTPYPYRV